MGKLIQYCTEASKPDGDFSKAWPAAGMGYIIETEHKHFILIDGGDHAQDAGQILDILEDLTPARPVTVDLWIISHPHGDHTNALKAYADDPAFRARAEVKAICFSAPDDAPFGGEVGTLHRVIGALGCEEITPKAGDTIDIDGTVVRFYFTWKDHSRFDRVTTFNDLSLIFSVTGAKKRAMFIGDSCSEGPKFVRTCFEEHPEEIKCDILQVAHHGLDGGDIPFYKMVDAQIVLVPASLGGGKFERMPETICNAKNMYAQNRAFTVIQAFTGTVGIEF